MTDQLFDTLAAASVDGVVVVDGACNIRAFNAACERMFGCAAAEVLGCSIAMLLPNDFAAPGDAMPDFAGSERELTAKRKDGSQFPILFSFAATGSDAATLYIGIIRDLSELRDAVTKGENASTFLAQIVEDSDDAIFSKTLDGVIVSWNKAAERMFGHSASEAIGKHISLLIPPDRLPEEDQIIGELRAGRKIDHFETVRRHRDGSDIFVSISVSPLRNGAGQIIGAAKIVRDIGERKANEDRLRQMQAELTHVARLSIMGQMSSGLAHELNQPLTAVNNYIRTARRLLDMAVPDAARLRDMIDKAAKQIQRTTAIIKGLREFVEKRERRRAAEDLNAVVREAVQLTHAAAHDLGVRIGLALDPRVSQVSINKVQIQQVLVNLILNGIEATHGQQRREIEIRTRAEGDAFAQVSVRDNGPGLSDEIRKRLFQPFATTKETGMGIGLNICQTIVEAHGGHIEAAAEKQPGAVFRFVLPLAQEALTAA
jgi:two-component system sensor kinase FixL